MENREKTQEEIKQEMLELNDQFSEFLHTKGISAKFKLAFSNMADSARKQHAADVESFNSVKAKSEEENKDFVEFLHAKGIKAKYKLVIENIKKGAKSAPYNTAEQIAAIKAQTQAAVARANAYGKPHTTTPSEDYSAQILAEEFNDFLKTKGLDEKYTVYIIEE